MDRGVTIGKCSLEWNNYTGKGTLVINGYQVKVLDSDLLVDFLKMCIVIGAAASMEDD